MMSNTKGLAPLIALAWMPPLQTEEVLGVAWYLWLLIIVVLLILLLVWLVMQNEPGPPMPKGGVQPKRPAPKPAPVTAPPTRQAPAPAEQPDAEPAEPDDLKRIEGIGPKIAEMLNKQDITTFARLAQADIAELSRMLDEAGLQMIDPDTWPQQASLAAEGKWEEFDRLTEELKGGRRVDD